MILEKIVAVILIIVCVFTLLSASRKSFATPSSSKFSKTFILVVSAILLITAVLLLFGIIDFSGLNLFESFGFSI